MMQQNPEILNYKQTVQFVPAVILSGETASNVISVGGMQLGALLIPADWDTSDLTFIASNVPDTDLNYIGYNVQGTDGANKGQLTIPGVVAQDWLNLFPHWFFNVPYLQIVSSNSQSADRTMLLALQPLFQGIHS